MSKSTRSVAARKPRKPRADFPLFPRQNGRRAKKVRGKLCCFDQKDDLLAGRRTPVVVTSRHQGLLSNVTTEFAWVGPVTAIGAREGLGELVSGESGGRVRVQGYKRTTHRGAILLAGGRSCARNVESQMSKE